MFQIDDSFLSQAEMVVDENKCFEQFRSFASPMAYQLACYLAAAPLRLPIMRLVQRMMLPQSEQVHLAEVFLSGLLKRVSTESPPADEIEYDFLSGSLRERFLDAGLLTDTVRVQESISEYINDQHGCTIDFQAWLSNPDEAADDFVLTDKNRAFAKVSATVLRRLGENYKKLLDRLETQEHKIHFPVSNTNKQSKELRPLNLVRAFFIGNSGAGKTSLIRTLTGEQVYEGKEAMTSGIDIREWPVGDTAITAHFWDFGGQVMAHSTHHFFLREHCLYILVMDARTEVNANEQAEYWLEHVRTFGGNAPVMLVGNKSELTLVNLDLQFLQDKYPNIIGFYPISCSQHKGVFQSRFEIFKLELIEQLQKIGSHGVLLTEQQFEVVEILRSRVRNQAFIHQRDFEILCAKHQITGDGEQNSDWFLNLLDKLGIIMYFPQLARLDSFILNPRWITYGIYKLLYSNLAHKSGGELSKASVISILSAKQIVDEQGFSLNYPPKYCGFLIDIMEEFKLCFRLPTNRKKIIIPDLLPSAQPQHGFYKQRAGVLAFEFDFRGFLPRHIMPTFIVSRYDEIKNNCRWQLGVLLRSDQYNCDALVQVDYHNKTLSLWLQSGQVNRYFTVLRDEIINILQRMPGLTYQEWLWLSNDMKEQNQFDNQFTLDSTMQHKQQEKVDFKQLLALEAAGKTQYITETGIYDLSKILQIMPEGFRQNIVSNVSGKELSRQLETIKIFISYSHEDQAMYDKLVAHLKLLQHQKIINFWYDREIAVGTKWKNNIDNNLEVADIILLLVSADFLASDYCYDIEMLRIMEKHKEKSAVVIPVLLHPCNTHGAEFMKLQGLPKGFKPVSKWKDQDEAFLNITKSIRETAERIGNKKIEEVSINLAHDFRSACTDISFANKEREMSIIWDCINNSDRTGGNNAVLVTGERRIGKSALFNHVQYKIKQKTPQRILLSINFEIEIFGQHSTDIMIEYWFFRQIRNKFDTQAFPFKFNWPKSQRDNKTWQHKAREKLLEHLNLIKMKTGHTVLFIFDDIQQLVKPYSQNKEKHYALFSLFRSLVQDNLICLIVFSTHSGANFPYALNIARHDTASPIFNFFTHIKLAPLSPDETWDYLRTKLSSLGVVLPNQFQNDVVGISRGLLWIIQSIGIKICENLGRMLASNKVVNSQTWQIVRTSVLKDITIELKSPLQVPAINSEIPLNEVDIWNALKTLAYNQQFPMIQDKNEWPESIGFYIKELEAILPSTNKEMLQDFLRGLSRSPLLECDERDAARYYYRNNLLPMWLSYSTEDI